MTYEEFKQERLAEGYTRVERDDRLLDVFPHESREKGIELWERWGDENVDIVRVHEPQAPNRDISNYRIPRGELERLLYENIQVELREEWRID